MVRIVKKLAIFLILIQLLAVSAHADGTGKVFWSSVQEGNAVIYIEDPGEIVSLSAQAGSAECSNISQVPLGSLATPVDTVIMVDNSLSIPSSSRSNISSFLQDLVGARIAGERFTIIAVSDKATYLCQDETDYASLKNVINSIQYSNQETYITDVLYEVLEALMNKQDGVYKRIVIVSDGVDNKEIGYTREELYQKMETAHYPVYAIGCRNNTRQNGQELENFFAIARRTSGGAYELNQNSMDLVNAITMSNKVRCVTAELPAAAQDGTMKGVRVNVQIPDGNTIEYTTQLAMPFAEVKPQEPEPVPEPEPEPEPAPEPEPERNMLPFIIGGVCVAIAVVLLAVILTVRLRNKKNRFEHAPASDVPDVTEVCEPTVLSSNTEMVFQNSATYTLVLTDIYDSARRYEQPLSSAVTIGRGNDCKIRLDYEPTVSRHQCTISIQNGRVMASNQSSANITMVDGKPLNSDMEVTSGSVLKMGRLQMKVEIR